MQDRSEEAFKLLAQLKAQHYARFKHDHGWLKAIAWRTELAVGTLSRTALKRHTSERTLSLLRTLAAADNPFQYKTLKKQIGAEPYVDPNLKLPQRIIDLLKTMPHGAFKRVIAEQLGYKSGGGFFSKSFSSLREQGIVVGGPLYYLKQ